MNADGSGQAADHRRRSTTDGLAWSPDGAEDRLPQPTREGNSRDLRHERRRERAAEPDAPAAEGELRSAGLVAPTGGGSPS